MGANDKKRKGGTPSIGQLWSELKNLRTSYEQLKSTVGKLKDILQVQDNWHSNITPWIKKKVTVWLGDDESFDATLLWTDRYNVGLEIDGERNIVNKGHVRRIKLAK